MIKNLANTLRLWALGLALVSIAAGFLIASLHALDVSYIYVLLVVAVVTVGLFTNIWGGLAASAVAVFATAILNQYLAILPVQSSIINIAAELGAFLVVGPVAGMLGREVENTRRHLRHWISLANARATHDPIFNTLKPDLMKIRLEEEVVRAQAFSRPLALGVLEFAGAASSAGKSRTAALQTLVRIARAASASPAVVGLTEAGQVVLILPEFSTEQARGILSQIESHAASERFFPNGSSNLGIPLQESGAIRTAALSLRPGHVDAEAFLAEAVSGLGA